MRRFGDILRMDDALGRTVAAWVFDGKVWLLAFEVTTEGSFGTVLREYALDSDMNRVFEAGRCVVLDEDSYEPRAKIIFDENMVPWSPTSDGKWGCAGSSASWAYMLTMTPILILPYWLDARRLDESARSR